VAKGVDALKNMTAAVETDLRALFSYYGEDFDSHEGPKPDDFFGMICSFSSSLQVRFFRHCCKVTVFKVQAESGFGDTRCKQEGPWLGAAHDLVFITS